MKVIFNEKEVGYACVEYTEYTDGQKSPTTFDSNFDGEEQDTSIWYGVKKMKWCLDRDFLNIEGYDFADNIICTRIFPIRRIRECYTTKAEPLQMNALRPKVMESVK
jgi:hypothetical protein